MAGFSSLIPTHLFQGAQIEMLVVGASSIQFRLERDLGIFLDYYGAIEDKADWLYNLPLCGEISVQSLVGQTVKSIDIISPSQACIRFSGGMSLDIRHDDVNMELMRFIVGQDEYIV